MADLEGTITLKFNGTYSDSPDIGTLEHKISKLYSNALTSGTGADQANAMFQDQRSTSGNDDLDLYGGLTDSFGNTLNFTSIKALIIKAASGNTDNLEIGAAGGSNEFDTIFGDATDKLILPPDGMFCLTNPAANGFGVTDSTADTLRIAAASGTLTYDIIVIGEV